MARIDRVKPMARYVVSSAKWAVSGNWAAVPSLPGDGVKALYLHHSTGASIWAGGLQQSVETARSRGESFVRIVEWAYPKAPYAWSNDPYDYWSLWVKHRGGRGWLGQATLEMLARDWDVIVVKHCFTASRMEPDPTGAAAEPARRTPANYRRQLTELKAVMREFGDTTFLVWTPPPLLAAATTPVAAALTEEYAAWLRDVWDEPGDNIHLWDFRAIAAVEGYLRPEYAAGPGDCHPNAELAGLAAPMFARRLVDVVAGRGDDTPRTGSATP